MKTTNDVIRGEKIGKVWHPADFFGEQVELNRSIRLPYDMYCYGMELDNKPPAYSIEEFYALPFPRQILLFTAVGKFFKTSVAELRAFTGTCEWSRIDRILK